MDHYYTVYEMCNEQEAEYILMKMGLRIKRCLACTHNRCMGPKCDIYVSSKEEERLGKYLINQKLKGE